MKKLLAITIILSSVLNVKAIAFDAQLFHQDSLILLLEKKLEKIDYSIVKIEKRIAQAKDLQLKADLNNELARLKLKRLQTAKKVIALQKNNSTTRDEKLHGNSKMIMYSYKPY